MSFATTFYPNTSSEAVIIHGTDGNDILRTSINGNSRIEGHAGDDVILGRGGNNTILGQEGNDRLYGGQGNDFLSGDEGDDFIFGGKGNDSLFGGSGNDSLAGGEGNDNFYFGKNENQYVVSDFESIAKGGNDKIVLTGNFNGSLEEIVDNIHYENGNAIIQYDNTVIKLLGIKENSLTASDFIMF